MGVFVNHVKDSRFLWYVYRSWEVVLVEDFIVFHSRELLHPPRSSIDAVAKVILMGCQVVPLRSYLYQQQYPTAAPIQPLPSPGSPKGLLTRTPQTQGTKTPQLYPEPCEISASDQSWPEGIIVGPLLFLLDVAGPQFEMSYGQD